MRSVSAAMLCGVAAHRLVAQRAVAQRLLALLGRRVEDDARSEHRLHERIRRRLVELLVGRAEERLLRVLAVEHHERLAGESQLADFAALVAAALHQPDGIAAQLRAGGRAAARRPRGAESRDS